MAYEFQKLSEVEALNEVPEGASVLAEVNGDIKRIPGNGLGGGGVKTAIIKSSDYDNALNNMATGSRAAIAADVVTYSCVNMTFEEAYQTMSSGEPLNVTAMIVMDGPMNVSSVDVMFAGVAGFEVPCIVLDVCSPMFEPITLFWTENGLSVEPPLPSGGK